MDECRPEQQGHHHEQRNANIRQEVVAEESAKDPEFKRIWDNLEAFRKDYAIWSKWAFLPRPGTVRESE